VSTATQFQEDAPGAGAPAPPMTVRVNKLDLLERLADDLAHEIKNPLHSMVINLEVLKRRLSRGAGEGKDDVLRYANVLSEELDRVHRRVELLLRLSRPERAPEETSLDEMVEELLELIHLEARNRGARVEFVPAGRMERVRVARAPVRQIILNLVLDALGSTGEGDDLQITMRYHGARAEMRVRGGGHRDAEPSALLAAASSLAQALGGGVSPGSGADGRVEHTFTLPLDARRGNPEGTEA
jgi:signal transduction histidine kinase